MTYDDMRARISRRQTMGLIGAAGLAIVVGCNEGDGDTDAPEESAAPTVTPGAAATTAATTAAASATPAVACVITPEVTEGPYFVDERLNRSDITPDPTTGEVSEGVPLGLTLMVSTVADGVCAPLSGAVVDVWHCDANGEYSDISGGAGQSDTSGLKFLRGYRLTDDNGQVRFATIYPGWYSGRTVHIHYKVRTDPDSDQGLEFTSQIFFNEEITDAVVARSPYSQKGPPDTRNATDNIYNEQLLITLAEDGGGYSGTLHVGVSA